jgi:hypothetical protein
MKRLISFSVLVLVLAAERMAVCQVESATSGEPQPANVRIEHEIFVENQPVLRIFLDVMRGTGLDGGFAEIADCSGLPHESLTLKQGTTVREAMDALVAANPDYQWKWEGGVVNLKPRVDTPLLDTKIAKFQMDATDREVPAILEDLLRLPEVREREAQLDLKPGLGQGGPGVYEEHPVPRQHVPVHIDVQNLSLREAFNKIVRVSQKGIWIYHEMDCRGDKTYKVEVASDY